MDEIRQQTSSTFAVTVDGKPLPADVEEIMSYVVVEDNLNLPDMFYLSFLDPEHTVISKAGFKMAAKVKISVRSEANTAGEPLFSGEVTAMECEFEAGKTRTVVRGFDRANRLYRGRRTRAFKDVKYSDIVKQVAQEAGLEVGRVETPQGRPSPHVAQANMTDAELLGSLAGEVGFVLLVEDGKVNFHPPPQSAEAPTEGDLNAQNPLQLVQGDNLLRFNAAVTADSQVKDVSVRGWDIAQKKAVIGTTPATSTSAEVGLKPAELAQTFGNATFTATDVPYGENEQVEAASKALAEQIASTHAQIEGVARGNPRLKAGTAVSLGVAGAPFEGKYTLTVSRHVFDNGEYLTHFSSTGLHERSMLGMTSAGGRLGTISPAMVTAPIPSVVSAIVTNVKDDEDSGRVKVKVPRLDDTFESGWLRVAQPGAGPERGALVLPEVDDEVLVAFEQGDIRRGYVLGGLYNGIDKPNPPALDGTVGSDGMVAKRTFSSRKGHMLVFSDKDGDEFVQATTKGEEFTLKLAKDAEGGAVLITSKNLIKIDAQGDITIVSKGKIGIEATGAMTFKGQSVSMEATTSFDIKGATVKVAGTGQTEVTGAQTKVAGSAMLDLDGGATANLHAGVVRIN
ncbi:MAG TPA: VgrG-related protein [Acidimicrobiales bacterium]|nr:VgrG-related protein [Acidimicrobiales bacterium]